MTDPITEDEAIVVVTRLTRARLVRYIEHDLVRPQHGAGGFLFDPADIARLELLCDLSEDLEMDEAALGVVVTLIDQVHSLRRDLTTVLRAIDAQPADLRARIAQALTARDGQ